MERLLVYLNSLAPAEREAFAGRCNTTVGYLRKACSKGQKLGETLCIRLAYESGGVVSCEDLRPDVDWQAIRRAVKSADALSHASATAADDQPAGQEA